MTDENSRDRIFKAVKKRIRETDEQERIQMIANIIGDRRYRDLVDILARIEGEDGWPTVIEYLTKSQHHKYSSPIITSKNKTDLEILKFREMTFELLSCKGLEPVSTETTNLLKELENESSLIDASRVFLSRLEQSAKEQILNGDTLFFDFSDNISVSEELVKLLNRVRNENVQSVSLETNGTQINVRSLWHCEHGRIALSTLGIKGYLINSATFDIVLSVIQMPDSLRTNTVDTSSFKDLEDDLLPRPENNVYRKLLSYLIHHEVNELSLLGSRHSVPLLNNLLDETSSTYEESASTTDYKKIIDCINAHISIRDIDSALSLEKSSQMKNTRIATTAILALGNFYHESSASILVKLICNRKNDEIVKALTKAIENLYKKCPEADYIIATSLESNCKNRGILKKLYRRLSNEKGLYYQ